MMKVLRHLRDYRLSQGLQRILADIGLHLLDEIIHDLLRHGRGRELLDRKISFKRLKCGGIQQRMGVGELNKRCEFRADSRAEEDFDLGRRALQLGVLFGGLLNQSLADSSYW